MSVRAVKLAAGFCVAAAALAQPPAPGERGTPRDEPRPTQREITTPPPSPPADTPTDPGAPLPPLPPIGRSRLELRRIQENAVPAAPPTQFNPDPGAPRQSAPTASTPFFKTQEAPSPLTPDQQPVPADRALPRAPLERASLEVVTPPAPKTDYMPLPSGLALPRAGVRENRFIPNTWEAPEHYPLSEAGKGYPANTKPVPDRWRSTGFVPWRRYTSGDTDELPYYYATPEKWHFYRQSILKGDLPIHGQDLFLNLTASTAIVFEDRKFSVPSGASAARGGSSDFYGASRSQALAVNAAFEIDLFKGDTVFKPVEWLLHIKPVLNYNRVSFLESGLVSPDPRGSLGGNSGAPVDNSGVFNPGDIDSLLNGAGVTTAPSDYSDSRHTTRTKNYISIQELFFEKHLANLSANYDFCAIKIGNQTFNTDFRGLIFNDTNLGVRFFGNYDNNRWQYNAALFDLREKDTNSDLNTFNRRGQLVFVANVYRQDFWKHGYTAEFSLHGSFDQASTHYDTNGGIVRPAPLGTIVPHRINSYYLGWAGDGHLDRWNLSHAVYLVVGRDEFNGLAGRPTDIFAQLAALELSYDHDWLRFKGSVFSASGDHHPEDGRATGFDSILDNTNFTGGPFSYYSRQGFNLGGTAVGLKQRFSLLPNLRTSKTEGQQNFNNPGLFMTGLGVEADVTPRIRAFFNANLIRFVTTAPIKTALLTNEANNAFGTDLSIGTQWRPLLTENIVISAGYGFLIPARGFRDIYRATQPSVPGFTPAGTTPGLDRYLHSAVLAVTFTY
jgi:hypothetical protein